MGLPRKLKNLNLFNDGVSMIGEVSSFTRPKLSRKMEGFRGGGMDGEVEIDMGADGPMVAEWTIGGHGLQVLRQFGEATVDGLQLRFAGAYQNDETGGYDAVEILLRGRHKEIDEGEAKPGEDTETKVTTTCSYYKLEVNGVVEIEIDVINMVFMVDGIDRLEEMRAILGV